MPLTEKRIPVRMCIGCRGQRPKGEMIRVVRSPEGVFSLDPVGKKPGRGAYLCPTAACLAAARKGHGLEHAFRGAVDAGVYDALNEQLLSAGGGET